MEDNHHLAIKLAGQTMNVAPGERYQSPLDPHQADDAFAQLLYTVLSPSRPIQSPEYLRGRKSQLEEIRRAFYSPGRHLFIYGFRGVGKTSLAQTAAFEHQTADNKPIFLSCAESNFGQLVHDMVARASPSNPTRLEQATERALGFSAFGFSASIKEAVKYGRDIPPPHTINDAVSLANFFAHVHSEQPIVVIDEFDQLTESDEQHKVANFVKSVSDEHINIKFILCGIGESVDELFKAHPSTPRYFHTVKLERLPWEARFEIIDNASKELKFDLDDTTRFRIAKISDGFPHYIHLLCEKLFWIIHSRAEDRCMRAEFFEEAMHSAVDSIEPYLKDPYELATRKYTNTYEEILWAVADTHQLQRPSNEIFRSYERIMNCMHREPLSREKFNARINRLKREEHGAILVGTRAGWYEFREKVLRGFARLRAYQNGVELDPEHPLERK